MNKYDIVRKIEEFAPLETQESWDCSGWGVELSEPNIKKIIFALTVTDDVVNQALNSGCDNFAPPAVLRTFVVQTN